MKTFSLRSRLTLLLALATLVALGIAAKVVDWRADSDMQRRFDASLLTRAQAFATLVHAGDDVGDIDALADRAGRFPGQALTDWYAVTCQGKVLASTTPAPPPIAVGASPHFATARMPDGGELRVVAFRFSPSAGEDPSPPERGGSAPRCEMRYALDEGPLQGLLHRLDLILAGSALGACALVLILTPWLVHRGLRPLAVLDQAMTRIGPDTPGGRLPASDTTELVPLVTRFNAVLARMDEGLARERQFASGLAHEFRTRLAELRALVDIETRYPSGHDLDTILGEVGSIGRELEATVTALLQLTRIQSGLEQARPQRVLLTPLVGEVCARHQGAAQARKVNIEPEMACDPSLAVQTDPALLLIALDNLLGNAVAYSPSGATIALRVENNCIQVCNPAPALQPEDLANFGQRFWRKGAPDAGHAGLGLALAGAAARALGTRLDFSLRDGVLRATLDLKPG